MLQKLTGIVLHVLKYNDTTNIADIYTKQLGRASFLVSVSRSKKTSTKPALFQPLALIEFEASMRPGTNLYRIKEAKSSYPFATIPYNPYKSTIVLFLAEFLYRAVKEETENKPLFSYLQYSILWLDTCENNFANFHLVFLMKLTRFLGLYPNLDDYSQGDYFDLLNASFTPLKPLTHSSYIKGEEAYRLTQLMRMNYDTMHLFGMNRMDRARCIEIINEYYQLHIPGFGELKSLNVLQELFD
jgi:DNA repair protein RecO